MTAIAEWAGFQWIGMGVAILLTLVVVAFAVLVVAVFWQAYGIDFHARKPGTLVVWSTYRSDVRTGEGKRVKCNVDLRVTSIFGVSWRSRWLFGVMTCEKDSA